MANWDKITSTGKVDDRRGQVKTGLAGFGIGGIILVMGVTYLMGGNPLDVLEQIDINQITTPTETIDTTQFAGNDSYEQFTSQVLGSINDYWVSALSQTRTPYTEPTLVLFRNYTTSGCSGANSSAGPHYCPLDATIYLDETFFETLRTNLGAKGGDVAEAYVIAHEVGHHVQNITGTLEIQNDSVKTELQADCYAGAWAGSIKNEGIFEPSEIGEAMDAAAAVGDDNIELRTDGVIHPESWTHGSSQARVEAFTTGYDAGDYTKCAF